VRRSETEMERYTLKTVASGAKVGLWVSLGFTSSLKRNDVLHIVSEDQATEAGARRRRRLYVERFDQLYSCDGGADLVRVRQDAIEVRLTPKAAHLLSFKSTVLLFEFEKRIPRYADALGTFEAMARVSERVEVEVATAKGRPSHAAEVRGHLRGRRKAAS
jgi:hypothetical protein